MNDKRVNLDKLKELAEHLTPVYLETLHELGGSHVRKLLELLGGVLKLCIGYDAITLDKAYRDACNALTGSPEWEVEDASNSKQ